MTRRLFAAVWLALALGACASDDGVVTEFDYSAGLVEVEVLGDGFVRVDERRIPLEALVLELRQATRAMARSELLRYVVRVRLAKVASSSATQAGPFWPRAPMSLKRSSVIMSSRSSTLQKSAQ